MLSFSSGELPSSEHTNRSLWKDVLRTHIWGLVSGLADPVEDAGSGEPNIKVVGSQGIPPHMSSHDWLTMYCGRFRDGFSYFLSVSEEAPGVRMYS